MTYKTILVHAEANGVSDARLQTAADLAFSLDATLLGVGAVQFPLITDPILGYVDPEILQLIDDQLKEGLLDAEKRFRRIAADAEVDSAWRPFSDHRSPAEVMSDEARGADLVIAASYAGQALAGFAEPGDLLMSTGLPVLMLPQHSGPFVARSILIAWKNTREARRAISDALPLLKQARRVVIAAVAKAGENESVSAELADVAGRLQRHGVTADVDLSPRLDLSVADQLLAIADSQGADLIVAGAYGRARAREWIFGGVTEHLLRASPKPVLFSR